MDMGTTPKHAKLRLVVESVENPMKLKTAKAPQLNAVNVRDPTKHGTTNVRSTNEAENPLRSKASTITVQIHRTQAHIPRAQIRGGRGGGGGITLKPQRQQIFIPIYTVKLSKV